jgi:hypothetical protein
MPYPRRNRLLLSNRFSYLLHATFSGAIAAPLPASLSVDVGGSLTINDTGNLLSVSGGRLIAAGLTASGNPRAMYAAGFARIAGRALLFTFRGTLGSGGNNARHSLGWYTSATPTAQPYYGPGDVAGVAGMYIDGSGAVASLFADNTDYDAVLDLRATGAFLLSRPTASDGAYTLHYVSATGSQATMYPGMTSRATDNKVQIDNLRVADLAPIDGRFAGEYGLATNRHLTPAAATTTASTADALIEFTFTFATAISEIHVRRTDANNHWIVRVTATGFLQLIENNAGVQTVRGSLGGLYSGTSTYRVVVVQSGTTITCYSSDVMRFTYASAVLNATATEVRVHAVGSAISELVCWPRNVTLAGGV